MLDQAINHIDFLLSQIRPMDLVDILLVWLVVYKVLLLVRRTGTLQMLSGLGILTMGYILSIWLELFTFNWLLEKFFTNLFVIVVILFQAEIRRALAHIGTNPFFSEVSGVSETQVIEEIAHGICRTAERGYGGLVVIEREIIVDYHIEMGTEMEAQISGDLILSIFHPSAPMHDGAILIRGGLLHSAGCFLPLSKNPAIDKNLGTRHRAAIGLTEETDAVVFVISEESKSVGVVIGGQLRTHLDSREVRNILYEAFDLTPKHLVSGVGGEKP